MGVVIHTGDFKMDQTPIDGQRLRLARLCRATATKACWRCSATAPTWSGPATRLRNGRSWNAHRGVVPRGAAERWWSPALPARFTASSRLMDIAAACGRKIGFVGPQHGGQRGDRARAGAAAHSRRHGDSPAGHAHLRPAEDGGAGERQPGRTDVFAFAHRGGQPPAAERGSEKIPSFFRRASFPATKKPFSACWITCSGGARWCITTIAGGVLHVSGHASQEEQKLLLNLVRPRYFIPVHGEYRQLFRHAALAHQVGTVSGEILLIEDGQPIEFTEDGALSPRAGAGGARVRGFRLAGGDRRGGDSRPAASVRRRHRRADHRHRQAHRKDGVASGNGDARLPAQRKMARRCWPSAREVILRTDRTIQRGRENRLERDQGKDSRGFEALFQQANVQAAADFAGDSGGLRRLLLFAPRP